MSYKILEIQQSSIKVADNIDKLNFTGDLATTISMNGKIVTVSVTAGLHNAYTLVSDGMVTAAAVGSETLTFRSANNMLSVNVTDNQPVYGDNVLLTINPGNISHTALANVGMNTHAQLDTLVAKYNNITVDIFSSGLISGGMISAPISGIGVIVSNGEGYVNSGTSYTEIIWSATTVNTVGAGINYIGIDATGTAIASLAPTLPNIIFLGTAYANVGNTSLVGVYFQPNQLGDLTSSLHRYLNDVACIVVSGCEVTEQLSPNFLKLNINSGELHNGLTEYILPASTSFTKLYYTTDQDWITDTNSLSTVNTTQWNDRTQLAASALVTMTDGYWKKDLVMQSTNGQTYYIYAQAQFQTFEQASISAIPDLPVGFDGSMTRLATIVSRKGDTTVAKGIDDVRPDLKRVYGYGVKHSGANNGYAHVEHEHYVGGYSNSSTGLLIGGNIIINAINNTKFDVSAGTGVIIDNYTDPLKTTHKLISWNAMIGVSVTNIATQSVTYIAIDETGAIIQSATPFWNDLSRQYIALGRVSHGNFTTIVATRCLANASFEPGGRLGDLITSIGTFNIDGNQFLPYQAALEIQKTSGHTHSIGVNFNINKRSPNISSDTPIAPASFIYSKRGATANTWTIGTYVTNVDPNYYDNGSGTLVAVPVGLWTVQPIWFMPGDYPNYRIEYGQQTFTTQALATALGAPDPTFQYNPAFNLGTIRTFLIVQQGTTNLSNTANATFLQTGKFGQSVSGGGGGGGGGAPVNASYIVLSSDPTLTNEKVIGTDFFVANSHVATNAGILESKLALNYPTHDSSNDPTVGEKLALTGTFGAPGATNRYVTDTDARMTNARTPTTHLIIDNATVGPQHTIANGVAGYVFKATGATTAQLMQLAHAELSGIGTNTHAQLDTFVASKGAVNGLATIDSGGKVPVAQLAEVLSVTDLTSYATASGTGSTAILSTITAPALGQVLNWSGTDWVNSTLPSQLGDSGANGIIVRTSLNNTTARSLVAPAAGFTITNQDGVAGNPTFVLSNDLGAIEALNGAGLYARTGTDAWAARTLTGTANQLIVTNGAGAAGDPIISISPNPVIPGVAAVTLPGGTTAQRSGTPAAGDLRFNTSSLNGELYNGSSWLSINNLGSVTSVALAAPSIFTVSGSPVISNGTLSLALVTQVKNTIFAGPTSGIDATPTFRTISLINHDLADVVVTTPTSGDVLMFNGISWVNSTVSAIIGRSWHGQIPSASGTTNITPSVTPPLITAGTQVMAQSITPPSTSRNYEIEFIALGGSNNNNSVLTIALFRTIGVVSTYLCSALSKTTSFTGEASLGFIYTDTPATTNPVTYSVRIGISSNTWYINRRSAENTYGGTKSGWLIKER